MGLQRNARHHQAGLDPEIWSTYAVGQRVMTPEAFPGVVTEVSHGPFPGAEHYEVLLDNDMGGGTYDARELQPLGSSGVTAAAGEPVQIGEYVVPQRVDDPSLHLASEDYPELAEILQERPPLAHAEALSMSASKTAREELPLELLAITTPKGNTLHLYDTEGDRKQTLCGRQIGLNPRYLGFPPASWVPAVSADLANCSKCLGLAGKMGAKTASTGPLRVKDAGRHDNDEGENDSGDDPVDPDDTFTFEGDDEGEEYKAASRTAAIPLRCADCGKTYFTDSLDEGHECTPNLAAEGGLWDNFLAPILDAGTSYLDKDNPDAANGGSWSYDWCRFRRARHCWYPNELDADATARAGYAVFIPVDRGICWRDKWDEQKSCSLAAPGPKSGDSGALLEATVPWSAGGQRGGVVVGSRMQVEAAFEFTATWADVRRKAKDIRTSGGVRVVSSTGDREGGQTVTAEVRGASSVYETAVVSEPGRSNVAMWTCGCPWAAYSWGRSGRWKKYEGRMCSHALALSYEVQSRGMFGNNVVEDAESPEWSSEDVQRPGDYQPPVKAAALRPVLLDGDLAPSVASWIAREMLDSGQKDEALAHLGAKIVVEAEALDFKGRLQVLWNGVVRAVQEILTDTQTVVFADGQVAPVREVHYPTFHPTRGLDRSGSLSMVAMDDSFEGDEGDYFESPEEAEQEAQGVEEEPAEVEAVLREEPEAALPATDATDVTQHQAGLGWLLSGPSGPPRGSSGGDIAQAARERLAKMALKDFSAAERAEIIDEGIDVRAANLGDLDVTGTHYENLDDEPDDELDLD